MPDDPNENYTLCAVDPRPAAPPEKREMAHKLLTHEEWWETMRDQSAPEHILVDIKAKMLKMWQSAQGRGAKVEPGRATSSTGTTPGRVTDPAGSSSGAPGAKKPKVKVDEDDL